MGILNNIEHSLNCWITMKNTSLIEDNYLWLWYQIIECNTCKKQYIVFRTKMNNYIEPFNDKMINFLNQLIIEINDYDNWVEQLKENQLKPISNIDDIIEYPIWVNKLTIYSIQDMVYWTEKIINLPFYDATNYY